VLGGGDAEQDVGFEDGAWQVGGDVDVDREDEAGEVREVFACVAELFRQAGGVRPEAELVAAATSE
jgi:hypothetical protein